MCAGAAWHPRVLRYRRASSMPRLTWHHRTLGGANHSPATSPPQSKPPRDAQALCQRADLSNHYHFIFFCLLFGIMLIYRRLLTKHNAEGIALGVRSTIKGASSMTQGSNRLEGRARAASVESVTPNADATVRCLHVCLRSCA